jgi:hypothetical protein
MRWPKQAAENFCGSSFGAAVVNARQPVLSPSVEITTNRPTKQTQLHTPKCDSCVVQQPVRTLRPSPFTGVDFFCEKTILSV